MAEVVEINAVEHLESIQLRWTSLLYETPGVSFFHTFDWLKLYRRHFGACQRLRVLLVHRHGDVLGILPLVVREETTSAGPGMVLTRPTISPHHACGAIGPNPTATLMASLRHLAGQARDWDRLSLPCIDEHDRRRTENAMALAGLHACHVQVTTPIVCVDSDSSEHVAELKQIITDRWQALERQSGFEHGISFERIRSLESSEFEDQKIDSVVEECLSLAQHLPNDVCTASTAGLYRDLVATADRAGMLDLNLLRLDGRLIASSLNVYVDGVVQQIGVGQATDPMARHAAAVLALRMVVDSLRRSDRTIRYCTVPGSLAGTCALQESSISVHEHRAPMPVYSRFSRVGQWLTSPLANA